MSRPNHPATIHRSAPAGTFARAADILAAEVRDIIGGDGSLTRTIRRLSAEIEETDALGWLAAQSCWPKLYYRSREADLTRAGLGNAFVPGAALTASEAAELLAGTDSDAALFCARPFDPTRPSTPEWQQFAGAGFVLPRLELTRREKCCRLSVNLVLPDDLANTELLFNMLAQTAQWDNELQRSLPHVLTVAEIPDRSRWHRMIAAADAAFETGEFEKIVLARRSDLRLDAPLDPFVLLERLAQSTIHCYHFLFAVDSSTAFLSFSPERLYRRTGTRLHCEAIAGTRRRGDDAVSDARLAQELLDSEKDRREHRHVVDTITSSMMPLARAIRFGQSAEVEILKLARVQHLITRFEVELREQVSESLILDALHPTAAVGGYPREAAVRRIGELEQFDRGWYAGPIGWIGVDSAEFAVGIRSALVAGPTLRLYAGAGIVRGSKAESEWDELNSKLSQFYRLWNL